MSNHRCSADADDPIFVEANETQLLQVFHNAGSATAAVINVAETEHQRAVDAAAQLEALRNAVRDALSQYNLWVFEKAVPSSEIFERLQKAMF